MPRIGRSFPPQWSEPAFGGGGGERSLGPDPTGIAFPPLADPRTPGLLNVRVTLAVQSRRSTELRRFPKQWLEGSVTKVERTGNAVFPGFERALGADPPAIISGAKVAPPIVVYPATGVLTNSRRAEQRRTTAFLTHPIIPPTAFVAPPVAVYSLSPDRLARRQRRQLPSSVLGPPILPTTTFVATPISVTLARKTLRRTVSVIAPPTTLTPYAVELAESTIRVALVRTRPRRTEGTRLGPLIFYPSTTKIDVTLVRARPRPTAKSLRPLIFYPATSEITVALVRSRSKSLTWRVVPPATLQPEAVAIAERTIRVTLVRARPRPTTRRLAPPIALLTFGPPVEVEVAVRVPVEDRRRAPHSRLPLVIGEPVVFAAPPLAVTLTRTRPRRTSNALRPLIFYPQTSRISVTLVRARPRPTSKALRGLIFYPATSEISVTVVRSRPRHTLGTSLTAVSYPATSEITVVLARIRPRPTRRTLGPLIFYPQASEIAVTLTRTRPRPTRRVLTAPTALATFAGPTVTLTHTRPRRTQGTRLSAPQAIRIPAVEQAEETIRVTLVRTRPRPTVKRFIAPLIFPATSEILVVLTRVRPRHTVTLLVPPTVLRVFAGPEVTIVRTRPRHTVTAVRPPTVVLPLPTLREETVKVTLAGRTRIETPRRAARYRLAPPTVIFRPPVPPVEVLPVAVATRRDWQRRFPWQGQRQRLVRETGTTTTYQQRDPFIGPRPPVVIDPLPTQRAETITTWLVSVNARRGWSRSLMDQGQRQRLVRETGSTVVIPLRDPFVGPRPPQIVGPLPNQAQQTVAVKLVAVRTRVEAIRRAPHSLLAEPAVVGRQPVETVLAITLAATLPAAVRAHRQARVVEIAPIRYAATGEIAVTLTRARPRPTTRFLAEPTVIRIPEVEQLERTIRVVLTQTRPRPTRALVRPPAIIRVPQTGTLAVTLTRTRPRPTRAFLTAVSYPATSEITVALVRARPRPTVKRLAPPLTLKTFAGPTVALTRIRPRPTARSLTPPTVVFETRPPERFEIAVEITRVSLVQRRPLSKLFPPAVVAPTPLPTLDQRTIRVTLTRIRPRPTSRFLEAPATLRPPPPPVPLWTDGEVLPTAETEGEVVETGASDGSLIPEASTSGQVVLVADSAGEAEPLASADGTDERTGLI